MHSGVLSEKRKEGSCNYKHFTQSCHWNMGVCDGRQQRGRCYHTQFLCGDLLYPQQQFLSDTVISSALSYGGTEAWKRNFYPMCHLCGNLIQRAFQQLALMMRSRQLTSTLECLLFGDIEAFVGDFCCCCLLVLSFVLSLFLFWVFVLRYISVYPKLTLNSWSSCPGVCHHTRHLLGAHLMLP